MENIQTSQLMSAEIRVPHFSHILFYALNVIILIVVVFMLAVPSVIKIFNKTNAGALSQEAQVIMQEAHIPMYLETSGRVRLGKDFDVVLHINSLVREVESVDVVLDYNPDFVYQHPGIIVGSESFPRITNINSEIPGQLRFTALADPNRPFSGEDEVARVAFNAKTTGDTTILLQHGADLTESSKAMSGGFDILEKTIALKIEIGPGL